MPSSQPSLLARLRQRIAGTSTPVITKGTSLMDVFGGSTRLPHTTLTNQREQMGAFVDWVYAAVQAVAEDVATIDFKLYVNRTSTKSAALVGRSVLAPREFNALRKRTVQITTKDFKGNAVHKAVPALEEIENHPLLDLLHKPNAHMNKDELIQLTVQHKKLAGESFWIIMRNAAGTPVELWPVMPYLMKVVPDSKKFIKGYVYKPSATGEEVPFDVEDVIHHKYTNPNNLYRGMSVVAAAARAIDTDAHAADYNRKFFYNSATPDGTLTTDQALTEDAFIRLKQEWNATYGGTSNAHKTAILESGLKFQSVALSQKDMDFLQSRNFNRDQILALLRVSKSILGLIEDANRANMEAADYNHAKRVTRPEMIAIANRITEDLAPLFDPKLVVGFIDPVPEDKEFMLQEKQAGVNSWMTIDEVRELEGKDPLPDDLGKQLYVPGTLKPLEQVAAEPEPVPDVLAPGAAPAAPGEPTEGADDDAPANKSVGGGPRLVPKASPQLKMTVKRSAKAA